MSDVLKKYYKKIMISILALLLGFMALPLFNNKVKLTEKSKRMMNYDQVLPDEEKIDGTDYVTFDAFFLEDLNNDGNAEGIRGNTIEIGKSEKLYFDLRVRGDVNLVNSKITFTNSNCRLAGTIKKGSLVSSNQSSTNFSEIYLKDLSNGFAILQSLDIYANLTNDLKSYSGINKVTLTGTVLDLNGNKITDIEKEVDYVVDWYGYDVKASIYGNAQFKNPEPKTNHVVTYNITSQETSGQLFLKTAYLDATISKLKDKEPISVTVVGNDIDWTYDETTRKITARRDASLDETLITKTAYSYKNDLISYNDWTIVVEYPWSLDDKEGFTSIYATSWYDAFNNENGNYNTILTSNKASITKTANFKTSNTGGPDPVDHTSSISLGTNSNVLNNYYIDKTKATSIYNGTVYENQYTNYSTSWNVYVPTIVNEGNNGGNSYTMILDDNNGDKLDNAVSLKEFTSYKMIQLTNLGSILNQTGTVSIIDADTEEVLHVFTATNANLPYAFEGDVKSIRLVVNGFKYQKYCYDSNNYRCQLNFGVNMIKGINDYAISENIAYNEFATYGTITSAFNIRSYNGDELIKVYKGSDVDFHVATSSYVNASSQANLSLDKSQIYTNEESKLQIKITTNNIDDVSLPFKNGEFMIVAPEDVLNINLENITVSDDNVKIIGKEIGKLENGQIFIKIITENDNEVKYTITLNTKIISDPRKIDSSKNFELYSYNPYCPNYLTSKADIYDINGNNDLGEKVGISSANLSFVAPEEILTTSILKNYNNSGSTTIAPLIAEVNPVEDDSEANIEINVVNNSKFSAKNIKIIGKVAYDDNTYQIGTGSLGSQYDVVMTSNGINVPSSLVDKATIYYSDKKTPTDDISLASNGWKLKEDTDFSKVKTYMIILDDYVMPSGEVVSFNYDIDMPMTTQNINKVTYFTHGVYYDLVTNAGLYSSNVGGAKLGIRMSRQYDLELTNLKAFSNRFIPGTKYILTDEEGNQKIVSTDIYGKILVNDLYTNKEYKLKQIAINQPYILDDEEKTIKIINDSNDNIVNETTGTFKVNSLNNNKKLILNHENETRYTIILKNTDIDSNVNIANSTFEVTGKGYENGKSIKTNYIGELTLKNLYLNEIYEIEQTKIDKYLLANKFTIKLVRDSNGEIKITVGKKPTINSMVNVGNYGYVYNDSEVPYYSPTSTSTGKTYQGYIPIDLTELSGTYTLNVPYQYYTSTSGNYFRLYLTDTIGLKGATFLNIGTSTSGIKNASTTKYSAFDNNGYTQQDIVGGKMYYLYVNFYNKKYAYNGYIYIPTLTLTNGDEIEYIIPNEQNNVPTYENINAYQSLVDNDFQDAPVLHINVKNKAIPTYTLKLTKIDADSNNLLAGAQYKVIGPGLPSNGKYITTDSNGQASIELYKKIYNQSNVNGFNYDQYLSEYQIVEVLAPVGYTLDKKSVTFNAVINLENGQMENDTYITDFSTEKNNSLIYSFDTEKKFKIAQWDNDNNILNVTMEDFPIVSVVKRDSETGNLLPNTLFAIFEVTMENNNQILSPAKDSNGNIIGDEAIVNGIKYYVVSTDENGKIQFNLGTGKYKLVEIQAADEKYSLTNNEYYFGVGETVPYQDASINLVKTFNAPDNYFKNGSYSTADRIKPTSDGGWIIISPDRYKLYKYDKNYILEWEVNNPISYTGTAYEFSYFDNPNKIELYNTPSTNTDPATDVIETSDGGFAVVSKYWGFIVKYDKDGNMLWQNRQSYYTYKKVWDHVCTYEGNTDANGHVIYYYHDEATDEWLPSRQFTYNSLTGQNEPGELIYYDLDNSPFYGVARRDNETYYCHYSETGPDGSSSTSSYGDRYIYTYKATQYINTKTSYHQGILLPDNDGGVINVVKTDTRGNNMFIKLADGTEIPQTMQYVILKYDKNGNLINAYNLDNILKQADLAYVEKYQLGSSVLGNGVAQFDGDYTGGAVYPNGDILLLADGSSIAIKLRYNQVTSNYDVIYYTPIGINGNKLQNSFYDYADGEINIRPIDNGGFTITYYGPVSFDHNIGTSNYFNTEVQHLDLELNNIFYRQYNNGNIILEFDGNGIISNLIIETTAYRNIPDALVYGYDDIKHIYGQLSGQSYTRLNDGSYIIGSSASSIYTYSDGIISLQPKKMVELANGEMFTIDPSATYIIYKINVDGYVEWIKQYSGISPLNSSSSVIKMRMSNDGKKILLPVTVNGQMTEIGKEDSPIIENYTGQTFLIYELGDEIQPIGPEAYTLNIENERKEYKITAKSNTGGNITVINPQNNLEVITTDGSSEKILERVKYGDTNKYNIKITPEAGYVISTIKVNGKDISYKVNDDLSVTLDKITDIKENKNIQVTYEHGISTVIVKHYLKDTDESVFSDELIHGVITTPYNVYPKTSNLYSLASENGEVILPNNMSGLFKINPVTVIFYYVENEVDLQTNYYIDGTEIKLAPTTTERKALGSRYKTSPIDINSYKLSRVIGQEEGILTSNLTQVTYMYQENTESKITIRYKDKKTGKDIAEPIEKIVPKHSTYTTEESNLIPSNYRLTSIPTNATGPAEDDEIEVIYYYEVIPFNIKVDKKISSILLNGNKESIKNGKEINIKARTTDEIIVYYEINVENTGDIKATFKVEEEEIPYFEIYDKGEFKQVDKKYVLEDELGPGEKETYKIGYKWIKNKYGISINEVEIKDVANDKGFKEPDGNDNKSTAKISTEKTDDTPTIVDVPVEDIKPEKPKMPNTYDNLCRLIALFIISLTGFTSTLLYLKKRMN